jgi:hypothetical protein
MKRSEPVVQSGTPVQVDSFLAAGFQALWWIWAKPSAWRAYLAARTPPLHSNFSLGDLDRSALSDKGTRRLFMSLLACWCSVSVITSVLVSVGAGIPGDQVLFAVLYGLVLSAAGTIMISSLLSVAAGVSGGLIIGSVFTLAASNALRSTGSVSAIAVALDHSNLVQMIAGGIPALVPLSAGTGAAISLGIGVTGGLTAEPAIQGRLASATRETAAVVVGIVLSGVCDVLFLLALTQAHRMVTPATLRVIACMLLALLVFCAAGLQQHSIKRMAALAGGFGAIAFASVTLAFSTRGNPGVALVLSGVITALFYSSLFSVAFSGGLHFADPWSGAIASALGSGIPFVLFLALGCRSMPFWPAIPLSILCIWIGMLVPRFLFIPAYPLEMVWNLIVYRIDQRRGKGTLLWRNTAFWDERQRLPLYGLDDHLLLALKRDPDIADQAMIRLGLGPNAWAVRAVRIELCARVLDECASLESIGEAHRALHIIEGASPVDPVQCFYDISRTIHAALQFENGHHRHTLLRTISVQINDLMLRGLPGENTERLQPALTQWRTLIGNAAHTLGEVARERAEIENPYVIGVPLTAEQAVFIGRSEVSAEITRAILSPQSPPLLLYGQRRMGKTSLLNNLSQILPTRILPLFVDLQGPASYASDISGLLAGISKAMVDSAFRSRGVRIPTLPREALQTNPFASFDQWLDSVEAAVNDSVLLLALDEFETLELSLERHSFDEAAVLGLLRHVIQHRRRFRVLVAASHSAEEFGCISSYLINLQMVRLGFLNEREIRQLVEHPLRDFALIYSAEATQRVIDLTRGHPHLLQLLCHEIVSLKNEQTIELRCDALVQDVEAAADRVLQRGSLFFLDIAQNQLSRDARLLAMRIARGSHGPDLEADGLDMLLRRDILEADDQGYRFQVELIRRWFARSNPG